MREERTEVLVVGAGPVGLLTAILLAEAGVEVTVIDREQRTASRSYACALHPRTLKLLDRIGLVAPLLERGRRAERVAFYDGPTRQAELNLSCLGGPYPFLLILPQHLLEAALERRLRQAGVSVHWNHRFDDLKADAAAVVASIEQLGATGTGYIVPHWETIVKRSYPVRAQFVVGADGHGSLVRQRLGIEQHHFGAPQHFAAYEFETEAQLDDEVRIVLDDTTTNVLWPMPDHRCRWTFQLHDSHPDSELPDKESQHARLVEPAVDQRIAQTVEKLAGQRAPWFTGHVKEIVWCTAVVFGQRLAKSFGRDRCWLAGDAAHQTGPVGIQSMNVGMAEALSLAEALRRVLRDKAPLSLLPSWDQDWQAEWRRLLGQTGRLKPTGDTAPWLRDRRGRLLSCLPASHEELTALAAQLGLAV